MDLLHKLLYIRKPFAREEVQQISLSLVKKWNLERELAAGRRQLTNSHRRLEAVLDATGDAIAMYDPAERLVFANRWYEALFDLAPDELSGLSLSAAAGRFRECSPEFRVPNRLAAVGPGARSRVVEPHPRRSGAPEPALFHQFTQPVSDGSGERMGDLVVYRDVSGEIEIERMKAEVGRLRSELETSLRLQRDHRVESGDAQGERAHAARRRQRRQRAGDGRERHGQGARRPGPCISTGRAGRARSSRSTARRCPRRSSRPRCSGTSGARSRARRRNAPGASSRPTAARCCSTRSTSPTTESASIRPSSAPCSTPATRPKREGTGLGLHSAANFAIGSGGTIQPFSDGIGHGATLRVTLRLAAEQGQRPSPVDADD